MAKQTSDLSDPRVKFNERVRARYLRVLTKTGRKYQAAKAAGVCAQTVKDHQKIDPEFDRQCEAALELYRDHLEEEVYNRGVVGVPEPVYQGGKRVMEPRLDKHGNVMKDEEGNVIMAPAMIRRYSDKMLELHTKRHIPEYRDRGTLDINSGGVMVVPGQQQTDKDWEQSFQGDNDVIEGEIVEEGKTLGRA